MLTVDAVWRAQSIPSRSSAAHRRPERDLGDVDRMVERVALRAGGAGASRARPRSSRACGRRCPRTTAPGAASATTRGAPGPSAPRRCTCPPAPSRAGSRPGRSGGASARCGSSRARPRGRDGASTTGGARAAHRPSRPAVPDGEHERQQQDQRVRAGQDRQAHEQARRAPPTGSGAPSRRWAIAALSEPSMKTVEERLRHHRPAHRHERDVDRGQPHRDERRDRPPELRREQPDHRDEDGADDDLHAPRDVHARATPPAATPAAL